MLFICKKLGDNIKLESRKITNLLFYNNLKNKNNRIINSRINFRYRKKKKSKLMEFRKLVFTFFRENIK